MFNIKGNHYRLIADVEYEIGIVFIIRVMTHREYDRVNVEDYEKKHSSVPPPEPIEAIKSRVEQLGLSENVLSKILGSRQRKSEILTGKR